MTKSKKNKLKVRQDAREHVLKWYIETAGHAPVEQCEDVKSYGETVIWWLSPPIPGVVNPVLVETSMGDHWGITMVPMNTTIRSFGGL